MAVDGESSVDGVLSRRSRRCCLRTSRPLGAAAAEEQAGEIQDQLGFFTNFLLVFAFVALFVGSFIIYNTFRIVVTQRMRELGAHAGDRFNPRPGGPGSVCSRPFWSGWCPR